MKAILRGTTSRRLGYDGWALKVDGAPRVLWWTFSTTRQEARDLQASELNLRKTTVVKVNVNVTEVES